MLKLYFCLVVYNLSVKHVVVQCWNASKHPLTCTILSNEIKSVTEF